MWAKVQVLSSRYHQLLLFLFASVGSVSAARVRAKRVVNEPPVEYLIVSQPRERALSYLYLSADGDEDVTELKPLVKSGLVTPTAVVVDAPRNRLYVADAGQSKIVFFNLAQLGAGRLITDGHQHLAVDQVEADALAVNPNGDLYFAGKILLPPPDAMAHAAIFLHPRVAIDNQAVFNPKMLYDRAYTEQLLFTAGAIAVDNNDLYWANKELTPLTQNAAVVRAPSLPPHAKAKPAAKLDNRRTSEAAYGWGDAAGFAVKEADFLEEDEMGVDGAMLKQDEAARAAEKISLAQAALVAKGAAAHTVPDAPLVATAPPIASSLLQLANTTNPVTALALSPRSVFFGTANGRVFASEKARLYPRCVLPTDCVMVTNGETSGNGAAEGDGSAAATSSEGKIESLLWDGDGSVYVADSHKITKDGVGGVFKIPDSETTKAHAMELILHVPSVHGMGYLKVTPTPPATSEIEDKLASMWGAVSEMMPTMPF
eukprot:CAMPEP_0178984234 /NCGR_PEP_ID=MMETSP0795-20121207/1492_1 /TAXON_ID=88552 /ORGANISM="Amoebophrya sp., Strain Ameob2" /LENGTH=485 /DNA_ID=CAMNT_0020675075 /DNA_START=283 /DNA_END=1740 /DNA_ORIENTATION=+